MCVLVCACMLVCVSRTFVCVSACACVCVSVSVCLCECVRVGVCVVYYKIICMYVSFVDSRRYSTFHLPCFPQLFCFLCFSLPFVCVFLESSVFLLSTCVNVSINLYVFLFSSLFFFSFLEVFDNKKNRLLKIENRL